MQDIIEGPVASSSHSKALKCFDMFPGSRWSWVPLTPSEAPMEMPDECLEKTCDV